MFNKLKNFTLTLYCKYKSLKLKVEEINNKLKDLENNNAENDKDWLVTETDAVPKQIEDNIYTNGNVSIGTKNNSHTLNLEGGVNKSVLKIENAFRIETNGRGTIPIVDFEIIRPITLGLDTSQRLVSYYNSDYKLKVREGHNIENVLPEINKLEVDDEFEYNVVARQPFGYGEYELGLKRVENAKVEFLTPIGKVQLYTKNEPKRATISYDKSIVMIKLDFIVTSNLSINGEPIFELPPDAPIPLGIVEKTGLEGNDNGGEPRVWWCSDNAPWCLNGRKIFGARLVTGERYTISLTAFIKY